MIFKTPVRAPTVMEDPRILLPPAQDNGVSWRRFLEPLKREVEAAISLGKGGFRLLFACKVIFFGLRQRGMQLRQNNLLHFPCMDGNFMAVPGNQVLKYLGVKPATYWNHKGNVSRLYIRWYLMGQGFTPDRHFLVHILLFSPTMPCEEHVRGLSEVAHRYMFSTGIDQLATHLGLRCRFYEPTAVRLKHDI
jgi:hypothetical protein